MKCQGPVLGLGERCLGCVVCAYVCVGWVFDIRYLILEHSRSTLSSFLLWRNILCYSSTAVLAILCSWVFSLFLGFWYSHNAAAACPYGPPSHTCTQVNGLGPGSERWIPGIPTASQPPKQLHQFTRTWAVTITTHFLSFHFLINAWPYHIFKMLSAELCPYLLAPCTQSPLGEALSSSRSGTIHVLLNFDLDFLKIPFSFSTDLGSLTLILVVTLEVLTGTFSA